MSLNGHYHYLLCLRFRVQDPDIYKLPLIIIIALTISNAP